MHGSEDAHQGRVQDDYVMSVAGARTLKCFASPTRSRQFTRGNQHFAGAMRKAPNRMSSSCHSCPLARQAGGHVC